MTSTELPPTASPELTGERADLAAMLAQHRFFLRNTTRGLTDEQAGLRTTRSELCLGGLIKHVARVERQWVTFIVEGPSAMTFSEADYAEYANQFKMLPGETLAGVLAEYEEVAERTTRVLAELTSLNADHPLPEAPWFEPGARWSARRVFMHIIAETAQHSGHADIVRESLDGAKSMG
ncbi:DinB family protein [Pseudonocardia eucalypti]|uniref:DinB family protein n=1 Tax=Pseudonocardia eucalypti TaxID=648755 RepID=A0ABP9QCD2_9PSEU|nr:putative damage-inducible protein DinB [Pseudonocardia eucalypti]